MERKITDKINYRSVSRGTLLYSECEVKFEGTDMH